MACILNGGGVFLGQRYCIGYILVRSIGANYPEADPEIVVSPAKDLGKF